MYKIKYIIFLIMLIPISTTAKTYYSEYSEFSEFSDEIIEKTDLIDVLEETRYLGYKENFEYIEEKINGFTGDVLYRNQRWVKAKPNLILDTKPIYKYYEFSNDRYISIKNLNSSDLILSNIKYNDHVLDKEIILKENRTFNIPIENGTSANIPISFKAESNDDKIKYKIYLWSPLNSLSGITEDIESKKYDANYPTNNFGEIYKLAYESEKLKQIKGLVETRFSYLTADTYYKTRYVNYVDQYFKTETKDFKIDLSKQKKFYKYRKREKIEIKDNVITDSNTLIEDLIDSTVEYKIISDLNYKLNGVYNLNIITPFETINEKVIIDNNDNLKKLIKELTCDLNETQNNLNIANYKVEKKNQEIKTAVLATEDNFLETENEKLKTELTETKKIKKDLNVEKTKRSSAIIGIILMLFILLIPIFKKEKNV